MVRVVETKSNHPEPAELLASGRKGQEFAVPPPANRSCRSPPRPPVDRHAKRNDWSDFAVAERWTPSQPGPDGRVASNEISNPSKKMDGATSLGVPNPHGIRGNRCDPAPRSYDIDHRMEVVIDRFGEHLFPPFYRFCEGDGTCQESRFQWD